MKIFLKDTYFKGFKYVLAEFEYISYFFIAALFIL